MSTLPQRHPLGPSSHLKRLLEVFERNHFDPEELHAHEERDDGLGHVRRSFPAPKLTKLGEKFLLGRQKSETKKDKMLKMPSSAAASRRQ